MIQIPDNIDSKYRFVILSALRARQIQGGSRPYIQEPSHKATQIAQKEILKGLIQFNIPGPNVKPQAEEAAEE